MAKDKIDRIRWFLKAGLILFTLLPAILGVFNKLNTLPAAAASIPTLTLSPIITTGLNSPLDIVNTGLPGDQRLFVVERFGTVRIIEAGGTLLPTPFLDITSQVHLGMLGMAFDPNYATNGYFYLFYHYQDASLDTFSRISRFQVEAGDPNQADPSSELIILSYEQTPRFDHSGGSLHFGPDGYLYISAGDGGSGTIQVFNGQDETVLLGKMLRIDVDGIAGSAPDCGIEANYTIPLSNPLADGSGGSCDEIWAVGMRNPWRFSFDRSTGDLWIADVGQTEREEIDFEAAGDPGGRNYGWTCYEGSLPFILTGCGPITDYVFPVHEYDHSEGCSITGGYVYRGMVYTGLIGHYVFSDLCSASFWSLSGNPNSPVVTEWTVNASPAIGSPVTFGEDIDGELYVADLEGKLYQIQVEVPTAVHGIRTNMAVQENTSMLVFALAILSLLSWFYWQRAASWRR